MKVPAIEIIENEPLEDKNTYRIGGAARYFTRTQAIEHYTGALEWARERNLSLFIIGKGSNLLISDEGWPGLVVQSELPESGAAGSWNENRATVSAAFPLNALVKESVVRGYAGMQQLAGIPGTVGGAVIMNAGAFDQCIADTLSEVTCVRTSDGSVTNYLARDLELGYRTSRLKSSGDIVVSASFVFEEKDNPEIIEAQRKAIIDKRKTKQPLEFPNCGSVFKRPSGNYAGTLIEQCGLKGYRCGGAEVSQKHANFIINTGNACAEDVRRLIRTVQQRVYENKGILLEPEVIFVGNFSEPLYLPPELTK